MPRLLTRRAFQASLLGLGFRLSAQQKSCDTVPAQCPPLESGSAQPFQPEPDITNIQRKPLSLVVADANETSRLRLAYQKLRELAASDPTDPRGWAQQANVHCFRCGGNPSNADIHQSWLFLPWHRAYLYYHERILCELLGDPTFRLPYWDWDVPVNRNLPTIHRTPLVSPGNENSLHDRNRGVNDGATMPDDVVLPDNINAMNAPDFASFGGTDSAGGQLENTSHGLIHVWTSNPNFSPSRTDMGCLQTAARDPIFYAHHGNIDRLWAEWNRRDPDNHANPSDSAWLDTTFEFFDHKKVLRSIAIRDVLDSATNLGFSYPPGAALAIPGKPRRFDVTSDSRTHSLRLSAEIRNRILAPGALNVTRFLVLTRVSLPSEQGLYYVYAGDPPRTPSTTAANYLGFMARLTSGHAHSARSQLMLNAGKGFAERAGASQGVRLTYVAARRRFRATRLDFQNVYMVER